MTTEMESAIDRREIAKLYLNFKLVKGYIDSATHLVKTARVGAHDQNPHCDLTKEALRDFADGLEALIEDHLTPASNLLSNAMDEVDAEHPEFTGRAM